MQHQNKTVVVTGGTQGIGYSIAQKFAQEGAQVIIGSRKAPQHELPEHIEYFSLDVSEESSVEEFFNFIKEKFGSLNVLVNNAGVMIQKHFLETTVNDWDFTMNVNLRGAFICSKYAVELMLKTKHTSIINMGSIEGIANNPEHVPYASSKSAIFGLTRSLAVDLGPHDIRCNTVCPGWIETNLNKAYFDNIENPEKVAQDLEKIHPLERLGKPKDIANMVSWLASKEANWITGQEFTVDGGRLAKLPSINFDS